MKAVTSSADLEPVLYARCTVICGAVTDVTEIVSGKFDGHST